MVVADISGNEPAPSAPLLVTAQPLPPQSFCVLPSLDLPPPIISQVQAVFLAAYTIVIRWDTDEPSASQIEYGASVFYGQTVSLL